jgi:MFS family permease
MLPSEARHGSDEEDATESAPLLNSPGNGDNDQDEPQSASKLLLRIYAIIFCVNLGVQILQPAQIQVYESIYCSQWYKRHPLDELLGHGHIPESYCKIAQVQTQISTLKGWLEFFYAAPGLLLSIPMGILTDKIGRRHLMILNLTVLCLTQVWTTFVTWFDGQIPLRAIWLGASLNLLSGGTIVTELLYVVCCS